MLSCTLCLWIMWKYYPWHLLQCLLYNVTAAVPSANPDSLLFFCSSSSCSSSVLFVTLWPGCALLLRLLRGLLPAGEPQCGHGGHAQHHPPVHQQPQQLTVSCPFQPRTAQTQPHGEGEHEGGTWRKLFFQTCWKGLPLKLSVTRSRAYVLS